MNTLKGQLAVIQAAIDGKPLQWRELGIGEPPWNDAIITIDPPNTLFNFQNTEWRVRPRAREWWMSIDADGRISQVFKSPLTWKLPDTIEVVHVREVLDREATG